MRKNLMAANLTVAILNIAVTLLICLLMVLRVPPPTFSAGEIISAFLFFDVFVWCAIFWGL